MNQRVNEPNEPNEPNESPLPPSPSHPRALGGVVAGPVHGKEIGEADHLGVPRHLHALGVSRSPGAAQKPVSPHPHTRFSSVALDARAPPREKYVPLFF